MPVGPGELLTKNDTRGRWWPKSKIGLSGKGVRMLWWGDTSWSTAGTERDHLSCAHEQERAYRTTAWSTCAFSRSSLKPLHTHTEGGGISYRRGPGCCSGWAETLWEEQVGRPSGLSCICGPVVRTAGMCGALAWDGWGAGLEPVASVLVGVCCCPPVEEVAKAFFSQAMEASNMHMLLLEGDFSALLSPGRASQQIYPEYFVVIILRLSVLFLLSLLQVVDFKPSSWKASLTRCILSEDTDFPQWIHWSLVVNFCQLLLFRESLLHWPACITYFLELLLPEITWSIYFVCFESVLLSVCHSSYFLELPSFNTHLFKWYLTDRSLLGEHIRNIWSQTEKYLYLLKT